MNTNTDSVAISIEHSKNIPGEITGVSISYGIDMIPYALVTVDVSPDGLKEICNPKIRQEAWINVKTTEGCLRFEGLIDGLSFSQSPGAISPSIVIKSKFQLLYEFYPRLPGFHPSAIHAFKRTEVLTHDLNSILNFWSGVDASRDFGSGETGAFNFNSKTEDKNIIEYIVELMSMMVSASTDIEAFSSNYLDTEARILKVLPKIIKGQKEDILAILKNIDTSAIKKLGLKASGASASSFVQQQLANSQSSLMDFLVTALRDIGCSMIIGREKLIIVPETGYLKVEHKSPEYQKKSKLTNVLYPSQYDNVTFNDNGYKDIKGVLLVYNAIERNPELAYTDVGSYLDEETPAKGGLMTFQLPQMLGMGFSDLVPISQNGIHDNKQRPGSMTAGNRVGPKEEDDAYASARKKRQTSVNDVRAVMDDIAQMKYLQAKYQDRTGSISALLNFNWVPGTVGTVYTRFPETFIDFFVTGVTHRIEKSPGASCTARTSIQFNCGRINQEDSGLKEIKLYGYNEGTMKAVQASFMADITKIE